MKSIRMLSVALALGLGLASVQVACSKDDKKESAGEQNAYVDSLYAIVKDVERDLSQGYLLRNATDRDRKSFSDVLYDIKISVLRLRTSPQDAAALSSLYLASQSYNTLGILEVDGSQLGVLKNKLLETIDVLARMQGKTLDNIERVLFEKLFTYDLAPFSVVTDVGKVGWTKSYHEDLSYAYENASKTSSWLLTPTFDLTNVKNPSFKISQAISNRGNPIDGSVFFLVSDNYTGGDPNASSWDVIPIERLPDGSGFTVVDSENVSLKRYEGKKIVMAFHYDSRTASNWPIWQINSFQLLGTGAIAAAPLTLTGEVSSSPGNAGSGSLAATCAGANAVNLFSYQFGKDLAGNFTLVDPTKSITPVVADYPDVLRISGFAGASGNKVGTSWVVSKDIRLSGTKDACVSVAEDIYLGKGASADDLSGVQVLVSTDYTGDVNKATWKTVPLKGRKAATGLVNKTAFAAAPAAVSLKGVVADGVTKVNFAFKYTVAGADVNLNPAAWWGIGDLTVAAVPTGTGPVVTTPTTDAPVVAPATAPTGPTSAFVLSNVVDSTYESLCYRFGTSGDYSKKYWSFTATSMSSLLLKYTDSACTALSKNADGSSKVWSTWSVATPKVTALSDAWSVVAGTCTAGCTAEFKTAMRFSGASLNEGSKIGTTDNYNIGEGKYVLLTKTAAALDLVDLAAGLSGAPAESAQPAAPAELPEAPSIAAPEAAAEPVSAPAF